MVQVDPALIEAFERDGVVFLPGILSGREIATLEAGVERNLADLGPFAMNATKPGEPGAFLEDFCNWQRIPEYGDVIRRSALAAAAGALMVSRSVRLFHDHLLVKEAGTRDPSPWHQDQPYYPIDGRQTLSFWIPLDPVARASTLEFVAGSHAAGRWYMPRSFVQGTAMVFDEGALDEVPDIDAVIKDHEYLKGLGKYEHVWGVGRHLLGSQVFDYWCDPWGRIHERWADTDRLNASARANLLSAEDSLGSQWGEPPPQKFVGTASV